MLSCYELELIVVKTSQFNCSQNPIYVLKKDASTVMTSKGYVEEHMIFKFQLESKSKYVHNAHTLQIPSDEYRLNPPSNFTHLAQLLEKLSSFSAPQLVGMSIGAGTILISLICAIGCLAWCGGVRNCPTSPKESFTRTPSE